MLLIGLVQIGPFLFGPIFLLSNLVWLLHFVSSTKHMGVVTCTQHYCWGTQRTVKWRKCPSAKIIFGRTFFRNHSGRLFFRKNLLPEEEFVIPEVLRNSFRKNAIRNVSGRSFFRKMSFYFRKKGLPEICFF